MYELHENEQYFFAPETLARLTDFLTRFDRVCLLCAPLLGQTLAAQRRKVRILDIDDRFAAVPGFRRWDIHRPQPLDEAFDVILCDPPFFDVSLSRLFRAIRVLAQYRLDQPLLVSYLRRRRSAILGTFHPFGLEPTGFCPTYVTVQRNERNDIELFGNLGTAVHEALAQGCKVRNGP
jgi:hypothetical protein